MNRGYRKNHHHNAGGRYGRTIRCSTQPLAAIDCAHEHHKQYADLRDETQRVLVARCPCAESSYLAKALSNDDRQDDEQNESERNLAVVDFGAANVGLRLAACEQP